MPARTGHTSRSNQACRCPNGASTTSNTALSTVLKAFIEACGFSGDVAEPLQLRADLVVVLRVVEVDHLLLEHVRDELVDRGIARHVRDLGQADVEVLVDL